jgi:hypothetical protein
MFLEEAARMIGAAVIYRPPGWTEESWAPAEQGIITSVGDRWVFVQYGADHHPKATDPAQLRLLTPGMLYAQQGMAKP